MTVKGPLVTEHRQHRLAYLLHEHVNVRLSCVQHIAVGVSQPLHGDVHGFAIYVDPSSCTWCQEQPGEGGKSPSKELTQVHRYKGQRAHAAGPGWLGDTEESEI